MVEQVWTFGRPLVILNTLEMANKVLVKKSAIYCALICDSWCALLMNNVADRPRQVYILLIMSKTCIDIVSTAWRMRS